MEMRAREKERSTKRHYLRVCDETRRAAYVYKIIHNTHHEVKTTLDDWRCVCSRCSRAHEISPLYLVKIHLLMAKDVIACVTVPSTHTLGAHTHTHTAQFAQRARKK